MCVFVCMVLQPAVVKEKGGNDGEAVASLVYLLGSHPFTAIIVKIV